MKIFEKTYSDGNITISLTADIVINKNPISIEISTLHKQATAYKDIDWENAINCLRKAKTLMIQSSTSYSIESWIRLPVFLQQAGRMEEACDEFQWLLDDLSRRIEKENHNPLLSVKLASVHINKYNIYNKWRLAWRREKRLDKAEYYKTLAEEEMNLFNEFNKIANQETKIEIQKYNLKRQQRRKRLIESGKY